MHYLCIMSREDISYHFIEVEIPGVNPEFFDLWISHIVEKEEYDLRELSFVFVTDEYLLQMNKEHLNHDYYTDIITFDYNEGNSLAGDLFISYDRVRDNARQLEVVEWDELCRVMIHGVLHLCGYGDKSEEEKKLMRLKEDECLELRKCFT